MRTIKERDELLITYMAPTSLQVTIDVAVWVFMTINSPYHLPPWTPILFFSTETLPLEDTVRLGVMAEAPLKMI